MFAVVIRRSFFTTASLLFSISLLARTSAAEPIKIRYPEGLSHGFVVLTDTDDKPLAAGELTQWLEKKTVVSRLVFQFDDGSRYDETVRFTQQPVLRLRSYHLIQSGPSFTSPGETRFEASGKYSVRMRPQPDEPEETAAGVTDIPRDVSNGLTSVVLKNLRPGQTAGTHIMAFLPKPQVLEVTYERGAVEHFQVGKHQFAARRFIIRPHVPGVTGLMATVVGKQPDPFYMWLAEEKVPVMVRFEGPLYAEGPIWRVGPSTLRWPR